ncbi:hypothetical protein UlMin_032175 [Ulmus minor]
MISRKKVIEFGRKSREMAALSKRRITFSRSNNKNNNGDSHRSTYKKGHFVIYTADKNRFEVPLAYLRHNIFLELLKMSEEVFGLSCNAPITLPFDAVFMEHIIKLVQRGLTKELEKALLRSINDNSFLSSPFHQERLANLQFLVCGY